MNNEYRINASEDKTIVRMTTEETFSTKVSEYDSFFKMRFYEDDNFNAQFLADEIFNTELGEVTDVTANPYTGATSVTPTPFVQTLSTKDKKVSKDITILAIPYEEVSNEQGGYTITIGGY